MPSLSDQMLAGGCALHVEAIHGEPVVILSGTDAGRTFTGVVEVQSDQILLTDLGQDPRAKVMIHFIGEPNIGMSGKIKTSDGRKWNAVRAEQSKYLTNDYELTEIIGKDAL